MSTTSPTTTIKIYQMNDCDTWMAPSLNDAIVGYLRMIGCRVSNPPTEEELAMYKDAELDKPRELTEEELDRKTFVDGEPDDESAPRRTLRQELARRVAAGVTSEFFATSQY